MAKKLEIKAVFRAIDRVTRPINKMQRRIGRFTSKAKRHLRGVARAAGKIGSAIKRGFQVAAAGLLVFGAAMRKVIQTGADFEKTLVSAAVKFPGKVRKGTEAYRELERAARQTGATTEFTASQSAEALNFLAMAGFNAKQAIAALPHVVDLATAANVELAQASDMATDTLGAMGLATKDATQLGINLARVNDVLAATTTSANTNMEQLFEAITSGGPTVTAAGGDIETFAAQVGMLAGAGIKGEKAGTALRNIFLRLQAPVGAARGLIKKYIGDLDDGKGSMIDIAEVIQRLNKSFQGMGKLQRAQITKDIFGLRAIGSANILLDAGADRLKEFRTQLRKAAGTSEEMARVIRDTTSGSIDTLKSTIEGAVIDLFKYNDEGIKKIIESTTAWIRANKELITTKVGDFIKSIIDNFGAIISTAKKIGKVIAIIFSLIAVLKIFAAVMAVVNAIMLANPIVLIITAIVIAVAAMAILIITYWDEIKEHIMLHVDAWVWLWKTISGGAKVAWGTVRDFFVLNWNAIVSVFESAVNYLIHNGPISWLIAAVGLIRENWEPVGGVFESIWNGIVDVFTGAIDLLLQYGPVADLIRAASLVTSAWSATALALQGVWGIIVDVFTGAVDLITKRGPIADMIEAAGAVRKNWEPIKTFFRDLWDGVVNIHKMAIDKIKEYFAPLTSIIKKVLEYKDKLVGKQIGEVDFGALKIIDGGKSDAEGGAAAATDSDRQMVSPQERTVRSFESQEQTTTSKAELVIRDATGRAELSGELGTGLKMQSTGTFD